MIVCVVCQPADEDDLNYVHITATAACDTSENGGCQQECGLDGAGVVCSRGNNYENTTDTSESCNSRY